MERTLLTRPITDLPVVIPAPRTPVAAAPVLLPQPAAPHPLAGKHALVVGINYAPEPTGTAPYTTALAEHMAANAGGVTVLTGVPHYPSWTTDPAHRGMLRSSENVTLGNGLAMTLKRSRHYVPARQNALTRAAYEASFLAHAVSTRVPHRPDLIVAVTPSLSGAVAGARLAHRHQSKLLIIVQELTAMAASQTGIRGGDQAARTAASIERYALNRADQLAIVSESFRSQLHAYGITDDKINLLPNWTHITPARIDQAQARRELGWSLDPFTVVHTGNIGLKQDLGNLVDAARLGRDQSSVHFVIVGEGNQRAAVQARAAGLENLTFVEPLSSNEYPKALAAADLLVVNERPGVQDMSLPSKLTSYLAGGRPVLAAVAADGATAQELRRTLGAASMVAPGNPQALLDGVLSLRRDPSRRARMSEMARAYAVAKLDPESATARFDALLDICLRDS